MSQPYGAEYARLLRGEHDRVRTIMEQIYDMASRSPTPEVGVQSAHAVHEAVTPPAGWGDYYAT